MSMQSGVSAVDGEDRSLTGARDACSRPDWEETLGPDLARCVEAVRRYCRTRTSSEVDAEDAAQDAFVRFLERAGADTRNPEAWLIQAASFECRDLHRRRRRDVVVEPDEASTPVADNVDPERFVTQRLLVQALLKNLPARDRQLLTLRYLADLSVEQLASRLRVSEGNARIMALRARRRAHDVLKLMEAGAAGVIGFVGWARDGIHARLRRWWSRAQGRGSAITHSIGGLDLGGASAGMQLAVPVVLAAVIAPLASGGAVRGMTPTASRVAPATAAAPAAATAAANDVTGASGGRSSAAAASGGPQSERPVSPAQLVGTITSSGAGAQEQDAVFSSMTPSPSYDQDGTIFASGSVVNGCTTTCNALFVTHDRGVTWSEIGTGRAVGGMVVLPATFPSDPTVFLLSPLGLERSVDGGATFDMVVPGAASAASIPGRSAVVVGDNPLAVYDPQTLAVHLGPSLPPGMTSLSSLSVLADGVHIVGTGSVPDPMVAGQQDGAVVLCDPTACHITSTYRGEVGLRVAISPTEAVDHTVVVFSGQALHVSSDDGHSFDTVRGFAGLVSVALDPDFAHTQRLTAGTVVAQGGRNESHLYSSLDGGRSFAQMTVSGLPSLLQLANVLALPDGRMIMALTAASPSGEFGLRCSLDHGVTWKEAC